MFEENVPSIDERLEAMRRVAERGYPVRAIMMPIIPIDGWQASYTTFTKRLLEAVPIQRLTLGGICIYRSARDLMERKMGMRNAISEHIDRRLPNRRRREGALLPWPSPRGLLTDHRICAAPSPGPGDCPLS